MQNQTVAEFLADVAGRSSVPGGGACAALHVAQGAALVCMVGRFSDGPKYADHADVIQQAVKSGDRLRDHALQLAERDAEAFALVAAAFAHPKSTDPEREARRLAIQAALAGAAGPPIEVTEAAREVVHLARELLPVANRNLIADLAAAAEAARAGAATALVNIQVNLAGISDPAKRDEFRPAVAACGEVIAAAEAASAAVLLEITR